MTWLWGLAAAAALLWPDRISGPFDGVPLDRVAEAVVVGFLFPALCWFHPRFLDTVRARGCIALLVVWKISSAVLFVPDGWCVTFEPGRPFAKDAGRIPHSWDMRADWRAAEPACSAIMNRSYLEYADFPAWFFNLPPANDSWPELADRPPGAITAMRIRGYVTVRTTGILQFEGAPGVGGFASVDGQRLVGVSPAATLAPGTHDVAIDAELRGNQWALVTRWNGQDVWQRQIATLRPPSSIDLSVRPWIRWLPALAALSLFSLWTVSALARIGDRPMLTWAVLMSILVAALYRADLPGLSRWAVAAVGAAVLVPVPPRLKNMSGAFVLIGIPWLSFVLVGGIPIVGRFTLYDGGNDFWMFQRFAYRIVMQGYWLEGGTATFYFQPLYRWIVGVLHAIFGDSSVGERFWDGACLLAGALLSFRIVRAVAGFRWGIGAGAMTLAVFVLGTARYLLGFGLSEISSMGLCSAAALCAIGSRRRGSVAAAAGLLATLAFYTRLNHLLMAAAVALFAIPLRVRVRETLNFRAWLPRVSWPTVAAIGGTIGLGLLFFAWRTWYYTGVFSVLHGTSGYLLGVWQPGMSAATYLRRLSHSVMMVLTVNDPPRLDVFALPVLGGAIVAVSSVAGVPRLREVPMAPVFFFFASIASAFVAYGSAYAGRFSIHVLPITCALATCGVAALTKSLRRL